MAKNKSDVERAMLRMTWSEWITDQIAKGANEDEATVTGSLQALCNLFGLRPEEFGLVHFDNGAVRMTYKTSRILAQLLVAVLSHEIENPPNLESLPSGSVEIPMAECMLPA